jgi:hypothetical protein
MALALLGLVGLAPVTANALSDQLNLQDLAVVIVDKGGPGDSGSYLSFTNGFPAMYTWDGPDKVLVTLEDFFIPQTNAIFGEFFWFQLEDPNNPGSFVPTRDLQLEWDLTTGVLASETFRTEMNFAGGSNPTSYFDLTLTTAGTAKLFCPGNAHSAIPGMNLPVGPPAASADLVLAASACAVIEMGVTNELPNHILALNVAAHVPEPASGLLVVAGLIGLAAFRRRERISS